jgi:hypothetical protein
MAITRLTEPLQANVNCRIADACEAIGHNKFTDRDDAGGWNDHVRSVAAGVSGNEQTFYERTQFRRSKRMKENLLQWCETLIGEYVFIRTVTYHYTGRARKTLGNFLFLLDACWIPNSGPFARALATGEFKEVEPYPRGVWINMDTIVDWSVLEKLPTEQK